MIKVTYPPPPYKIKPNKKDQDQNIISFFIRTKKSEQFSINANHCRFWPALLQKQFQLVELELLLTFASRFVTHMQPTFRPPCIIQFGARGHRYCQTVKLNLLKCLKSYKNVECKINFNRVKHRVVFPLLIFLFWRQPCASRNIIWRK